MKERGTNRQLVLVQNSVFVFILCSVVSTSIVTAAAAAASLLLLLLLLLLLVVVIHVIDLVVGPGRQPDGIPRCRGGDIAGDS